MPAPNVPTWADGPAGGTPATPTRLNQVSTAILEVFNRLLPVVTNFNPPNLTAGSSAEWDIPLGVTLAGAHTEWSAVYAAGLENAANSRISSRGARLISTTTVRLTVRNDGTTDLDLGARDFVFIMVRA